MLIVGKDHANEGKFSFDIWAGDTLVETGSNYPTQKEAEKAGQFAHRAWHQSDFKIPENVIVTDYMSDDELFAELGI